MTLQSMTGFARSVADHQGTAIAWEVKSVNGKSAELRLRLPPGFEQFFVDVATEKATDPAALVAVGARHGVTFIPPAAANDDGMSLDELMSMSG